ncbi:MAG: exo-alpha-sialidase [Ignavibacteriae bacterium]|nr:MAG: exo-alpha-sialidase [Ignavibacteriota bacterium]
MTVKKYLLALTVLLLISPLFSQYKNIKVNPINNAPEEVSIAINPLNPQHMVVGANLSNYYYSFDGGNTWGSGILKSSKYGVWGDPTVIFDYSDNVYYFHLARPSDADFLDRIVCQKSIDGGISWSDPGSFMGYHKVKDQDKQWAVADWKIKGNLYCTWTRFDKYGSKNPEDKSNIMFSRSTDFGHSWSDAFNINETPGDCKDSSNTTEGAVPSMGPNGEIFVSWSGPDGIVFDKSTDAGNTWLDTDVKVTEQVGGWDLDIPGIYRCNGMPVTCCDISESKYKGNIYINFSDIRNGISDVDIFFVKSTDNGNTWSKVKRVNDDYFGNSKQQFMSWMAVDPITGAINILFYDRRNYDDKRTDVYLARSTDGGETFQNIKISESEFTPQKNVFFGDYVGIAAYNNFTASVWQRLDGTELSIWYCGIDFNKE